MVFKYLRYYKYLLKHKAWVFYYCFKLGIPFRGLFHDLSKFLPYEAYHYANATFGPGRTVNYGLKNGMPDLEKIESTEFYRAVVRHKLRNSHHWESWTWGSGKNSYKMEMDRGSLLEMIADWKSANKMHKDFPSSLEWYKVNKDKIILHKKTRRLVEFLLKKDI